MQHLQSNTTLQGGKYRIDRVIGQGGFSNTYAGYNIEFDERIAIKEFFLKGVTERDDTSSGISVISSDEDIKRTFQEQKDKFKKEARRLRKLSNMHIVSVHDLFEENGTIYYIMDYIDGENLSERIKRTGKPLSENEVWKILPQVLDALKAAHAEGLLHLDIKPGNIMIDRKGNVKLIDFGASKQLDDSTGGAMTGTAVARTPGYAPREQMEQSLSKMGPWTDIYSLGATLYALLTNKRPPMSSDIDDDESTDKHEALPLPNGTSRKMHDLIIWMMSPNRAKRPQSVDEVLLKIPINKDVEDVNNRESEETILRHNDENLDDEKTQYIQKENKPHEDEDKEKEIKKPIDSTIGCLICVIIITSVIVWFIVGLNIDKTNSASSKTETNTNSISLNGEGTIPFYYPGVGDGTWAGGLKDGEPEGHGTLTYKNGYKFVGSFHFDGSAPYPETNGHGTFYDANGNIIFDGEYKSGKKVSGTQYYANGNRYTGTYEDGNPKNGTLISSTGEILFKGEFRYGERWTGTGKEVDSDYSYEGEYKDGLYDGKGTMIWKNVKQNYGYKYEGEFKKGDRNGFGTMYYKGGGWYEGNWVDGYRTGTGTYYYADHTYETGTWKNNKLIKETESGTWSDN